MAEPKPKRGRGPDAAPRKGSPRRGRRADAPPPPDNKPGRIRRERALAMLVEGESPIRVAKLVKVNKSVVYDWLKMPAFADELARRIEERDGALRQGVERARRRLHGAAFDAADTLVQMATGDLILPDETDDDRRVRAPRVDTGRVRAAEAVLNRVGLAASQTVTLAGGVDLTLPDLRAYTPEQLAAMAGDDAKPTTKPRK